MLILLFRLIFCFIFYIANLILSKMHFLQREYSKVKKKIETHTIE